MRKPGRQKHVKHGRPKCENMDAENMLNMVVRNVKTWKPKIWTIFNDIWLLYRQDLMYFQPTKNQEIVKKHLQPQWELKNTFSP